MKWFDQWFMRKSRWAWENRDMVDIPTTNKLRGGALIAMEDDSLPWNDGLRINIKKVIGGFVVSFRTYDRAQDRSDERHHIITDEQDFNQELAKMITLESMRQS